MTEETRGRSRLFDDTEEDLKRFNDIVEKYFADVDAENKALQESEIATKYRKSYSMGKLALALDMHSDTLREYENYPLFSATIKKARERVRENLLENALLDKSVASVSIFALKALHGMRDGQETIAPIIQVIDSSKIIAKND